MRLNGALFLGLGLLFGLGCATTNEARNRPEWLNRFQSFWTDNGPDAMTMEFAYIRRSLDDPYLTNALWHDVDENCMPLEQRPLLAANGLRIGLISGTVPAKLQHWLCSDGQSDAHRLVSHAGHCSFIPLGDSTADCTFTVQEDNHSRTFELPNAQCGLSVRLSVAENGDTVVRLEPHVRYGELGRIAQPAANAQSLEITGERAEEKFPALACELTLTPNDYLIIGGVAEKPTSLGYTCFFQPETSSQFILVIRTARVAPSLSRSTEAGKPDMAYNPSTGK